MKSKNHINTNSIRTIKKSFPRFLSLMIMSLLGAMVYIGLQATSPDMLKTIDNYFDKSNAYDIKIISSKGLIEDDVTALKEITNIKDVEGTYSKDILIENGNQQFILNVSSLPNIINEVEIIDGRLPKEANEIIVEENFITKNNYKIGDTITLNDDDLINKELTIVGTVLSPLYFNNAKVNQSRGTTSIGNGTINYYSYMLASNFDLDYFSAIYVTVNDTKEKITSKDNYNKLIAEAEKNIKQIKSAQEENRYNKIYNEANDEILKKEEEANTELTKAKQELDDAKKTLDDSKSQLDSAKTELDKAKKQLANAKTQIDNGKTQFNNALKQYNINANSINSSITTLKNNITNIENVMKTLDSTSIEYQSYQTQLTTLNQQLQQLNTLASTKSSLESAEKTYNTNYAKYQSSYKEYTSGLEKYNEGLKKYNEGLEEYNESKTKVEKEFSDAKAELLTITKPQWYIYNRDDDQTYASYINQTKSIKNLSAIFPVVFYGVAILVSLISMNRMVEDDRGEIGTLKSLGFSNSQIIKKYVLFSLLATLLGGSIGAILGLSAIPYLIFVIYRLLFILPNFHMGLNLNITITGLLIAIICICGSSIITAKKILKEKPANLMRPKSPKSGKKILLERIAPLWHHINFSNKITIRNIFRYKKRVLVTIIGITGCTSLMLCGFGIKDSIVDITNMQYLETFTYDVTIYTNDLPAEKASTIFTNDRIKEYISAEQISATLNESNISIIVTENNEDLSKVTNLIDYKTEQKVSLKENKVIISDKLADIHNINVGDKIKILDSDKNSYTFEVSDIVKNYMGHYIYMDKNTLEKNNKTYEPNLIYLNTEELSDEEKDALSEELITNEEILNVIHMETLMDSSSDMLDSLDKIIAVLIILAASLSFVVLYNLSNINIIERKREIATLKVLGFFDKEVDNYITKENLILSVIGIILGLGFGYFLTNITIGTVEMENTRFLREISLQSYILTSLISITFTFIVNFVTHFSLQKIDMIESLKSVE